MSYTPALEPLGSVRLPSAAGASKGHAVRVNIVLRICKAASKAAHLLDLDSTVDPAVDSLSRFSRPSLSKLSTLSCNWRFRLADSQRRASWLLQLHMKFISGNLEITGPPKGLHRLPNGASNRENSSQNRGCERFRQETLLERLVKKRLENRWNTAYEINCCRIRIRRPEALLFRKN